MLCYKRLNAPKAWMLDKLGGVYAPRPSTGPHKLRESLPLVIFLRNRLKYALTNCEVTKIVMQRLIKVDGKIRTDPNYPAGFMGEFCCLISIVFYFCILLNVQWALSKLRYLQYQEYHSQKMANNKASSSFRSQIELHIPSVLPKKCTKIFYSLCTDTSTDKYRLIDCN